MKRVGKQIAYLWALTVANLATYRTQWKRLLFMSFFMMLQNSMFFVLWIIFFQNVSNLKGWGLVEVARMFGVAATSIGLSCFFFKGVRSIAFRVQDNSLDLFLTRPRSVLPMLMLSDSSPASLGDILYGPLMWATLGDISWHQAPHLLVLCLLSATVFTAIVLIIHSIAFWLKNGSTRFSDQLFECLLIFSTIVQHGQPLGVQLIMYTIMPVAFVTILPTQLINTFQPLLFAQLLAGTLFFVFLSIWIFNAGLRRYKNAMI